MEILIESNCFIKKQKENINRNERRNGLWLKEQVASINFAVRPFKIKPPFNSYDFFWYYTI